MFMLRCCLALALVVALFQPMSAREWVDSTGLVTIQADLVAFNEKKVVLQRENHELVALPIEQLSDADREYLQSAEAGETAEQRQKDAQTWTLRDGTKVIGKVVDYCRKDVVIQRKGAKTYVNDRLFDNLPEIYRKMVPKIVAHFENATIEDKSGLEGWLIRQKGEPRTFTCEGVILELESGDEYGVPFFFFAEDDLKVLQPGWEQWAAAHEQPTEQQDAGFMVESLASAYQKDKEIDRQIALMQLNLQAVEAGVTALWEVALYPGTRGAPLCVVVPGRNSREATANALQRNPGYRAGAVRRVSSRQ